VFLPHGRLQCRDYTLKTHTEGEKERKREGERGRERERERGRRKRERKREEEEACNIVQDTPSSFGCPSEEPLALDSEFPVIPELPDQIYPSVQISHQIFHDWI
jgi:hypothetical protein